MILPGKMLLEENKFSRIYNNGGIKMRKFIINVNGNEYEVEVEEVGGSGLTSSPAPARAAAPAEPKKAESKPVEAVKKDIEVGAGEESVEAPMPGTILRIEASEGASVNEGDVLLILEAMKMENEILAPVSGTVKAIGVSEGASVDTGDVLVVIE